MEELSVIKFTVIVIHHLICEHIVMIRKTRPQVKGDQVTGDDHGDDVSLTVPLQTLLNTSYR